MLTSFQVTIVTKLTILNKVSRILGFGGFRYALPTLRKIIYNLKMAPNGLFNLTDLIYGIIVNYSDLISFTIR